MKISLDFLKAKRSISKKRGQEKMLNCCCNFKSVFVLQNWSEEHPKVEAVYIFLICSFNLIELSFDLSVDLTYHGS